MTETKVAWKEEGKSFEMLCELLKENAIPTKEIYLASL